LFGSAFSYIALRILGEGPQDGESMAMDRARRWVLDHGGCWNKGVSQVTY